MIERLARIGIEVESLDAAAAFYGDRLGLAPAGAPRDGARRYRIGERLLVVRAPGGEPRGGLHVHLALAAPAGSLAAWRARLAGLDPVEHEFGAVRSLYVFDPDRHCVEVAIPTDDGATPVPASVLGPFEVVLEVRDLAAAERRYRALGYEVVDRGADRSRVRLAGPPGVDAALELWAPGTGLAGARGGVHVDLAFVVPDPAAAADAVEAVERTPAEGGLRVRDPDGHALTFRPA